MTFDEILRTIEAREAELQAAAFAALPEKPVVPALIARPSTLVRTDTAFGGYWLRRRYEDGTESRPTFMREPDVRYVNWSEVTAAQDRLNRWQRAQDAAFAATRLIQPPSRRLLAGTDRRSGSYNDFGPRTLAQIEAKSNGASWTASYCREIITALRSCEALDPTPALTPRGLPSLQQEAAAALGRLSASHEALRSALEAVTLAYSIQSAVDIALLALEAKVQP